MKQVPDTESLLHVDTEKNEINTQNVKWVLNPYDEYAVEEALRIKADAGAGKVTVVSVGPKRAENRPAHRSGHGGPMKRFWSTTRPLTRATCWGRPGFWRRPSRACPMT